MLNQSRRGLGGEEAAVNAINPSAGYAIALRVELQNAPGQLGRLTTAIGRAGGDIFGVDLVEHHGASLVRDLVVKCRDEVHGQQVAQAVGRVRGAKLVSATDRTFELHQGGKIAIVSKFALRTRDDLSMAYTPGVGRVSMAIADDPARVWDLTIKRNSVAIITDGSAVLGLGNIGPAASLPVMEGKAMLFKDFAGVDAYPICLEASSPDQIVEVAAAIATGFGGINLEDIAAPACFEVEEKLQARLDIPVFHDDQHGTAVVALAALINAARLLNKKLEDMRVVVLGAGAAGIACARLLLHLGVGDVIGLDRTGTLYDGRSTNMNPWKQWLAENSNRRGLNADAAEALRGADAFIGVSGPGLVEPAWLGAMAKDAIVFALANPIPEIMPEQVPKNVRVVATGRSDYPNQINNVLVFPGFFRGLLDCRARATNNEMKVAAARALAALVSDQELAEDYIVPSVFDKRIVPAVSGAVREAAEAAGLART